MMISSLSVLCKKERATREEEGKRIMPSPAPPWHMERGCIGLSPTYVRLTTLTIGRTGRDIGSRKQTGRNGETTTRISIQSVEIVLNSFKSIFGITLKRLIKA